MEKTLGRKPKALAEHPDCPEELKYIWDWYLEMRGGEYLTFTEIKAWSELTHQTLLAWEVDLVKTLDRLYWRILHD